MSKTLYKFIISRRFWLDTIRFVISKRKLGYYIILYINSKLTGSYFNLKGVITVKKKID